MRAFIVGLAFLAFAGVIIAQPNGAYSSTEGKFNVRFPGTPKVTTKTTDTGLGELSVSIATFANADGNLYMVSYTDLPTAPEPQHHAKLFTGVRDGIKGNGKQVEDKEMAFGPNKLPGREFVVDKGKQQIKLRVILHENRLYQIAVIGTANFIGGKDAHQFLESFELTK
jgi:hypothetical protein